ncbi:MAG: holo-ACP synthase [Nannocystaceae bacterium]|nr:holo-ACP synthase [Nannocystaceae bacterium]
MSVLGLGLDLCPIDRMESAVGRHGDRFVERIFTALEKRHCEAHGRVFESLAGRFAAKEATSKALGAPKGIGWHDVEVVPAQRGERGPTVVLRGRAREVAEARGVKNIMISITHAGGVAAAVAVAVG